MDAKEFNDVFSKYRMKIFRFCNKILEQRQDAEEATISTFVELWRKRNDVPEKSIIPFLMIAAKSNCLDIIRFNGRHRFRIEKYAEYMEQPDHVTDVDFNVLLIIHSIIEELPQKQKTAFKMRYFEERKVKDIAELLKSSKQTISNQLMAAMTYVRKKLKSRGINNHGLIETTILKPVQKYGKSTGFNYD